MIKHTKRSDFKCDLLISFVTVYGLVAQQYSGGETNFHHNQDSFLANNNFQDVAHGVFPHLHLSYESLNPQVYYYEYMGFRKPDAYNYQPGKVNGGFVCYT